MRLNCRGGISTVRVSAYVCWCGLLILAPGCGGPSLGKLVPVQGKVALADGTPMPDGQVMFHPIDRDPNARPPITVRGVIEDGAYTLSTNGQPGAPEGKYKVVLIKGSMKEAKTRVWWRVPAQYFSQQKTPLEVEIAENKPAGGYDLLTAAQFAQLLLP